MMFSVPRGFRQAVKICRKAFLLWACRRGFAQKNSSDSKCDPVNTRRYRS
jgi:hypothetical protein